MTDVAFKLFLKSVYAAVIVAVSFVVVVYCYHSLSCLIRISSKFLKEIYFYFLTRKSSKRRITASFSASFLFSTDQSIKSYINKPTHNNCNHMGEKHERALFQ